MARLVVGNADDIQVRRVVGRRLPSRTATTVRRDWHARRCST